MRLRNKKTGEIAVVRETIHLTKENDICCGMGSYNSLAELNEEWEDYYEEPKNYWYIGYKNIVRKADEPFLDYGDNSITEKRKEIGNYFDSREEAEKVVEKLKAWKRLKDMITCIDRASFDDMGTATLFIRYEKENHKKVKKELDLLFGGEE